MQEEILLFSYCTMVNQELFFIETLSGLPAKMNPDNGDVSYCSIIENFTVNKYAICDIRTFDDRVYALAASGKKVIIFDLEKFQCQYIPLQCAYRKWGNFVAFEQFGSDLYIFPRYGNKICIMNTSNNEIMEITDYFDGITELQCACRADNKVWLLPRDAEVIGCYDLTSGQMQIYKMQKKIENCIHAVVVDDNIYILSRGGIYVWNIRELKLKEERILKAECSDEKSTFVKLVYAGNKLIVLPSLSDEIKILDVPTGSIETYHDYPKDFIYYDEGSILPRWSKYAGICEDDNYYYCAMRRGNYLLKISKQDGTLSWIKPNIPNKDERIKIQNLMEERRMEKIFVTGEQFCVERERDIGRFLDRVSKREYSNQNSGIGKLIFDKIKY